MLVDVYAPNLQQLIRRPIKEYNDQHIKAEAYFAKIVNGFTRWHFRKKPPPYIFKALKVVSAAFLLVCFVCLKESTCETRKNVFYFTSKTLFVFEIIKF